MGDKWIPPKKKTRHEQQHYYHFFCSWTFFTQRGIVVAFVMKESGFRAGRMAS